MPSHHTPCAWRQVVDAELWPGVGHCAGQAPVLRVSVQLRSEAGPEAAVIAGGAAHAHDEGVGLPGPAVSHRIGGTWNTDLNEKGNQGFCKIIKRRRRVVMFGVYLS